MALGRSAVLGIEPGTKQLRVVHGEVFGHRLRVYDFASEEILISNPENVAQQLETLVSRKRLRSSWAALALSGPEVVHRLLDFPPMPLSELGLVVDREIKTFVGVDGKDVVFDWETVEESASGNLKQIRVLVAIAPRFQVDGALNLLNQCGLKPGLITTAPLSLLRGLSFVPDEAVGSRVVLYLGSQQGYLLGVKNGFWSFYREFSSHTSEKGREALLGEALKEVHRALLYHTQRYPGEGEVKFLFCGEGGLEDLQIRLQGEMGIQGEVVRLGPGVDLAPLKERDNIFRDLFPSLMIPIGLVAASDVDGGINLVPRSGRKTLRRRTRIDLSLAQRSVLALVLLLSFLGLHLFLVRTERHYQGLLQDRSALYSQWLPAIQAAEESRVLRDNEKLLAQSIGSSRIGETSWIVLFKVLSRLAPPDLILESMNVQRDKGKWLITLKGEVVSSDAYTAQAGFNRFYQGLKSSPYFEQVELLPLKMSTTKVEGPGKKVSEAPATEGAGVTKTEGMEIRKTKVEFAVRARAKEI